MIQTRIDLVKKNEKRIHLIYRLPPTVRLELSCPSPFCHLPPSLYEQCIHDAHARTHSFISALWVYDILHTRARIYRRSFATASRYEIAAAVAKARCSRWDRGLSWSRAEHGVDCDRSIDRCQWWTRSIPIETRRRYTTRYTCECTVWIRVWKRILREFETSFLIDWFEDSIIDWWLHSTTISRMRVK